MPCISLCWGAHPARPMATAPGVRGGRPSGARSITETDIWLMFS